MRFLCTVCNIILLIAVIHVCSTGRAVAGEPYDYIDSLRYLTEEFRPYQYEEDGRPTGLAVEVLQLMWDEMGVAEQHIEFLPWQRAYEMTIMEPNTILFSMVRTPQREPQFKWVGPIQPARTIMIARSDSALTIDSVTDLTGKAIGVIKEYAAESILRKYAIEHRIHVVPTITIAVNLLVSQRIQMLCMEERAFNRQIAEMGLSPSMFKTLWVLHDSKPSFAFHLSTPDSIIVEFQKALDTVRTTQAYKQILKKYLK